MFFFRCCYLPKVQGARVGLQQVIDDLIVHLTVAAGHIPLLVWLPSLQKGIVLKVQCQLRQKGRTAFLPIKTETSLWSAPGHGDKWR